MRRSAVILIIVFFYSTLFGQEKLFKQKMFKDLTVTNTITKSYGDSTITFHVEAVSDEINPEITKRYSWFDKGEVKSTQGGYAGKLLHGTYSKSDRKDNLLEKGSFNYGLKAGTWLSWYANGNIARQYNWKQGDRTGKFQEFHSNGQISKTGSFKRGKLHGKVSGYDAKGALLFQEKYRNGKIVNQKKPKEKQPATDNGKEIKRKPWWKKQKKDSVATAPGIDSVTQTVKPNKKSEKKNRLKKSTDELPPSAAPLQPNIQEKKKRKRQKGTEEKTNQ